MSIFSRIGEIINANINAMLDKAEEPEKMVRLMIHEMEDTLTEVKSSAAEIIAERIRLDRALKESRRNSTEWQARAELALSKDREDLAREALERKLSYDARTVETEARLRRADEDVRQYQEDIARLEDKLKGAYSRKKELLANIQRVQQRQRVEEHIYRVNTSGAFERFDALADRLEANFEVNRSRAEDQLARRFSELEHSSDIDAELAKLRNQRK